MRRLRAIRTVLVAFALLASQGGLRGGDVDRERVLEITGNIVCDCGCPPTLVRACSCHRAEELTAEVEQLLVGKTNDEVFQSLVAKYGAKMLAAPKAEGFNLLGWVFPFVALAIGGGAVVLVYRRLRVAAPVPSGQPGDAAPGDAGPRAKDDKYRKLIEDALSED